ncbi:Gfo/Idh/MocA family oxidoreductase [Martelella sp. HB161492]|uniref:Gfo/Idh/MocA family protein n=1 Tax=Martelella sp. HB161492 TaxID=2720726 RepID=UPI00158F9DC8|nr:Gfo/Idh/MocA family oxidoreductase [Martelella sp. HB161492]
MTLNIGWIGCGLHASQMLMPQLGRNDMRLAAVCDLNAAAAEAARWRYGAEAVYSDWRDLIAHKGLDAIGMAVGPDLHREASIAALQRGLPVFLEKPPARDRKGAEEIAHASEKANKPVIVGFMKRYSTGNKIAANIIRKGDFGPVLGLSGSYMSGPAYFGKTPDYTSFFLHHCVHYMDLMPWLAGAPFADFEIRASEHQPGHMLMHMNFACENGAIGNIIMGTIQSRGTPTEAITIMGDHRRIEIENVINIRYFRDPAFKADDPAAGLADGADTLSWTPNFTAAANEDHKGYAALMHDAALAFAGDPSAAPTIFDGVSAMASLERMAARVNEELRRRRL